MIEVMVNGCNGKMGQIVSELVDKNKNTGIGLKNMQDRVQALNGTLRIEGEKGFRIFAMIPKEMP